MDEHSNVQDIRAILEIARREVNRGNPELALEHLRGIRDSINSYEHTPEWVDYSLVAGEAFLSQRSQSAESFLTEAKEKIVTVPNVSDDLRLRVNERLGDFYRNVAPKRPSLAKEYFALAKGVAVMRHVDEEIARIELKIVCTDLQTDKNPKLQDFQTMRRIAKAEHYTDAMQLIAWSHHLGDLGESMNGMYFGRGISEAGEDYFRDLLRSVNMK